MSNTTKASERTGAGLVASTNKRDSANPKINARRHQVVTAGQPPATTWQLMMLPALLFAAALFVGSTFKTLPLTLGAAVSGILIGGFFLQWMGFSSEIRPLSVKDQPAASNLSAEEKLLREKQSLSRRRRKRLQTFRYFAIVPMTLLMVLMVAATRVGYHMAGNLNPIAMVVDVVAHAMLLGSIVLWVFYPSRGHPAMLIMGLLLVLTTVTAGGVSHSINGQLVAALFTVFGYAFATDFILSRWQVETGKKWRRRRRRAQQKRNHLSSQDSAIQLQSANVSLTASEGKGVLLYSILALSLLLMSTSAAGHLASNIVPGLQLDLFDRLSQRLESVTTGSFIGGSRYVRGSKLGSVRRHMLGDPNEPSLRAYADNPPGYLRGTIFDRYRQGSWSAANERSYFRGQNMSSLAPRAGVIEGDGTTELQRRSGTRLERFEIRKEPDPNIIGTVEIHNVPMKGQIVFTSISTDWIEATTYGVQLSHHDMVVNGVDTQRPYVLGIADSNPREELSRAREAVLLSVPQKLSEVISPIAKSVCDGHLTAKAKSAAVIEHFRSYTYSMRGAGTPSGVDPVTHFLQTQHPAHCEYFASAAALMLRTVGVPTRYVTGYVAKERSEDDKYWLARNRDAHAWVEAYDDISERWIPIEATVGRRYLGYSLQNDLEDFAGASSDGALESDEDRTLLGQAIGWLLSFRTMDSLTVIFRVAQLPLFCMVIVLLWIRHRQKVRSSGDPEEIQSRQMLQKVDRRLRKRSLVRGSSETLHQFATRIETDAVKRPEDNDFLKQAADWYRDFAAARYRGLLPQPLQNA